MTTGARVSISTPGAITAACIWMTCAVAAVYASIPLGGQCYWCAPSATVMDWFFRLSFTATEVDGCVHRTHGREIASARSKLRASELWRKTWALNVGDYRISKSSIPINRELATAAVYRNQWDHGAVLKTGINLLEHGF